MANKRMFSLDVVDSSRFLRMPPTTRLLYYDLGMNADDDGFVEWYSVVTKTKASEQDMGVLQANGFIHVFNDEVLVILDWKVNNLIKGDRYHPTIHQGYMRTLSFKDNRYGTKETTPVAIHDGTIVEPSVRTSGTKPEPQVRLGKDRLGKVSKTISSEIVPFSSGYALWMDEWVAAMGFRITKRLKENENALKACIRDSSKETMHEVIGFLHWMKTSRKDRERPHWFQYTTSFIKVRDFWDNIQAAMTDEAYQLSRKGYADDLFTR